MAAGDPIKLGSGTPNVVFLLSAETGIIITSTRATVGSKKLEIMDASVGYMTGKIYYDFRRTGTTTGYKNGTTGLAAAAVGVVATHANFANTGGLYGVATGGVYSESVESNHTGENCEELSINFEQNHAIS